MKKTNNKTNQYASAADNIITKASRSSFPQAKRVGNPSEYRRMLTRTKEGFRTSRNDQMGKELEYKINIYNISTNV